jgi:cyclophilin family peptidyl-prolyl cis-trans isomerase
MDPQSVLLGLIVNALSGGVMKRTISIFLLALILIISAASFSNAANTVYVNMKTDKGIISFVLWPEIAPKGVENFIALIKKGFYNGTCFNRVEPNFVLQFGDVNANLQGGASMWGKDFSIEVRPDVKFDRPYILAYGNQGNDHSNNTELFITLRPVERLNMNYTIIGEVVSGEKVVDAIGNCAVVKTLTLDGFSYSKPLLQQKIISIVVAETDSTVK